MSKQHQYNIEHLTRIIVLVLQCEYPTAFDDVPMSRLLTWTPDERGHMEAFENLSCKAVLHRTGVNPAMLGAWACLAHALSKESAQLVLQASDLQIWSAVEEWEKQLEQVLFEQPRNSDAEANLFAPGPIAIAELLEDMD